MDLMYGSHVKILFVDLMPGPSLYLLGPSWGSPILLAGRSVCFDPELLGPWPGCQANDGPGGRDNEEACQGPQCAGSDHILLWTARGAVVRLHGLVNDRLTSHESASLISCLKENLEKWMRCLVYFLDAECDLNMLSKYRMSKYGCFYTDSPIKQARNFVVLLPSKCWPSFAQ